MSFCLRLSPADTMAIGDGKPFNQNDAGRAIAASVFPPPPDTLYGAARVACARALGWDGTGNWCNGIAETMGDWDEPGTFKISGPFFRADGDLLLPIPSHVVLKIAGEKRELALRQPAKDTIATDLGELRLPDIPPYDKDSKYLPLAGRWATAGAIMKLLAGELIVPEALGEPSTRASSPLPNRPEKLPGWSIDDLSAPEYRVGIARDAATRIVKEGHLYAAVRRALRRGVEILLEADGMQWPAGQDIAVQLGGEARFAFVSGRDAQLPQINHSSVNNYLVYFATPVVMDPPMPGSAIDGLLGRMVMASITNVTSYAGREKNTDGKGNRSKSNLVLPAGSVLFMENSDMSADFPDRLGRKTHMGYGRYFTGEWR